MELVDAVEVLGLGDEHEVGVAAGADEREALEQMVGAEVLAGGEELALVLRAPGAVLAAPGGVDLQERVLHEMTVAHGIQDTPACQTGFRCSMRARARCVAVG